VGIDIGEISKIHDTINGILSKTFQTRRGKMGQVLGVRQHYAGLIDIGQGYALALHADGVGTKVLVAEACHKYDTIGIDCVAMNVNDVICLGAEPLALVDYLALEKTRPELVTQIIRGLQRGAREAGVAIVSGETAIMPDVVKGFDLAAMVIGLVRKDSLITGEQIEPGDVIFGLRSSGIHSNGLTLARKVLLTKRVDPQVLRELLRPTRIYVDPVLRLVRSRVEVHALAHITGGAYSKLKRIGLRSRVGFMLDSLPNPQSIFQQIQYRGHISDREMYRTFNMGIGFLIVSPMRAAKRLKALLPEAVEVGYATKSRSALISRFGKRVDVGSW
jgi:phosphoribosylformylglycinamidine cyclo-ligase